MCFRMIVDTEHTRCEHKIRGNEQVVDCHEKPNGPHCADPPLKFFLTATVSHQLCPDCKAKEAAVRDCDRLVVALRKINLDEQEGEGDAP